jgi:tetratricopeptide (TPR) repeat protein
MVVDPGCMKCMDCISVCPNDALYFGFGRPTLAVSKSKSKPIPRNYSLTWPEEIIGVFVFLGSFLAVRGVYALVPFLMALGWAAVTTFLALKTWRLLRAKELSFHRLILKSSGTIQTAGRAFLAFSIFAVCLTAHSGWVRFHEYEGDQAFQKIQVPDELALAQINPGPWIRPIDRDNILEGKKHLQAASDFGLFLNGEALPKLAWFEYLSGNAERSIELLDKAANHQKGRAKALSLYYRGTILNRLGRYEQARTNLDAALAEREDLILAREEKGESLWLLGRNKEAIAVWTDAVQRNERLALVNNQLAGAKRSLGGIEEAVAHERLADQFTPDDPLFHWMLGIRLKNLGMNELAEKHFQRAIQLDPKFQNVLK